MSNDREYKRASSEVPLTILADRGLVHRILLTDPERFHTLTVSGKPRMLHTPSFNEFCASLDNHDNDDASSDSNNTPDAVLAVDLSALIKGAFCHEVCRRINQSQSLAPAAHALLLDLHAMLRNLIPSRRDLHKLLADDSIVRKTDTMTEILSLVIQAAQALQALESVARAPSTNEWIQSATNKVHVTTDQKENRDHELNVNNPQSVSYLVTSIMYLLFKAELCQTDKQDFYLSHVWAMEILQKGPELERINFETEFGPLSNASTAPATRTWIRMLVEKARSGQQHGFCAGRLSPSVEQRRNLIRVGWVESLIFHSPSAAGTDEKLLLPEIFALDQGNIQAIRRITRLAAAGSALALHACQIAGQPVSVLNHLVVDSSSSSPIALPRLALVQAMSEQWKPQKVYEQDVTTAALALAMEWKSSPLDQQATDVLARRTTSVLRAQDPVLQVLDGRMTECFRQVVLMLPELVSTTKLPVPTRLQTGTRDTTAVSSTVTPTELDFTDKKVRDLFRGQGLSFYAVELSMTAKMAAKIVELALDIYGGEASGRFLDRIILDECSI